LNDSSRRLNAPRSTTRRHRPGGTSRGSCWSWIPGASAPKQLRWRMTVQPTDTTIGVEVTRCSRDQAQHRRRHHRGAGGAGSVGGGSGAAHPAPSTDARPPAGSCPTDTPQLTNRQTCQADRIPAAVTGANHAPRRCPCRPQGQAWNRSRQQLARHQLAGAAATLPACVVRGPGTKEQGACHLRPCEGELPRQAKHAEVQPIRPQGVARRPSAQSTRRLPASANHRRSR
jgi:hypothetical protein